MYTYYIYIYIYIYINFTLNDVSYKFIFSVKLGKNIPTQA
jgi:hypothetical protein